MKGIEQFLQVDAATLGALKYAGTWNASTNTPTLASGVGVQGQYYVVSVAGSTNLDGETNWQVGDWAVFNGSVWQKVDGGSTSLLTTLTVTGNTYLATTSGSVGIGTSSPATKLHVTTTSATDGVVANIENSATGSIFQFAQPGVANWRIGQPAGVDAFAFYGFAGGTYPERMRIDSSGNVGIGTTSPSYTLDVRTSASNAVRVGSSSNAFGSLLSWDNPSGESRLMSIGAYALVFGTNTTERMRIDASGNVGIGTSSPGSFDTAADNLVVGTTSGNNGITIAAGTTGASTINFADGTAGGAQYAGYIDYQHSGDYMRFGTNGGNERMRLDSSGNLGIGTSSPSVRLQLEQAANSAPVTLLRLNNSGTTAGGPGIASRISFTAGATALGFIQGSNFASGAAGLQFSGDGTNAQATLDASGNLGLGVTPSAWNILKGFDISSGGALFGYTAQVGLANNAYYDGSSWRYKNTDAAAFFRANALGFEWHTAPSGTAGNAISFTQAMTLDASGNLLVGQTSNISGKLQISGAGGIRINEDGAGTKVVFLRSDYAGLGPAIQVSTADPLLFLTSNTERARITSSGDLLVGTTANTEAARLNVQGGYIFLKETNGGDVYLRSGFGAGTDPAIQVASNDPLLFVTNNTERARIDASGNLLVGTTSGNGGSGGLKVNGQLALASSQGVTTSATVNDSAYYIVCYSLSGTCTLTLPTPASHPGRLLNIVVQSAQQVVSASSNVAKITDGSLTTEILPATAGKWAQLWCDGTYWNIIATNV